MFLKISQISQENTKVAGPRPASFIKKETRTQVFSCEICEIFKNTYLEEHIRTAASEPLKLFPKKYLKSFCKAFCS